MPYTRAKAERKRGGRAGEANSSRATSDEEESNRRLDRWTGHFNGVVVVLVVAIVAALVVVAVVVLLVVVVVAGGHWGRVRCGNAISFELMTRAPRSFF